MNLARRFACGETSATLGDIELNPIFTGPALTGRARQKRNVSKISFGRICTVKVANGSIPLPPGLELPDGAEVQLIVPDSEPEPSFADRYAAYIGAADDLPADLSENLDHYVHGHSKK